jgi:hypothetical protein
VQGIAWFEILKSSHNFYLFSLTFSFYAVNIIGKKSGWGSSNNVNTPTTAVSTTATSSISKASPIGTGNESSSNTGHNDHNNINDKSTIASSASSSKAENNHEKNITDKKNINESKSSSALAGPTPEEASSASISKNKTNAASTSFETNHNNSNTGRFPTRWSHVDDSMDDDTRHNRDLKQGPPINSNSNNSMDDFPPVGNEHNDGQSTYKGRHSPSSSSSNYNHHGYNDNNRPPSARFRQSSFNNGHYNGNSNINSGPPPPYERSSFYDNHHNRPYNDNNRRHYNSEYNRDDNHYNSHDQRRSGPPRGGDWSHDDWDPSESHNSGGRNSYHNRNNYQEPYNDNRHDFRRPTSFENPERNHHHSHHPVSHYSDGDRGYNSNKRYNNNYSAPFGGFDRNSVGNPRTFSGGNSKYNDQFQPQYDSRRESSRYSAHFERGSASKDESIHSVNERSNRKEDNEARDTIKRHDDGKDSMHQNDSANEPKQILKHQNDKSSTSNISSLESEDKSPNQSNSQEETNMLSGKSHVGGNEEPSLTEEKPDSHPVMKSSAMSIMKTIQESLDEKRRELQLIQHNEKKREDQLIQQQQSILKQVEATRAVLAKKKVESDRSKQIHIEHEEIQQIVTQQNHDEQLPVVKEEKNVTEDQEIIHGKNDATKNSLSNQFSDRKGKDLLFLPERDEATIQKSKEEYYARVAAEKKARIEHRKIRKPRTRGVLFKRLEDGTIVNADLSAEELARRAQKITRRKDGIGKARNKKSKDWESNPKETVHSNEKSALINSSTSLGKNDKKQFPPTLAPTKSAWKSGPPPSMKVSAAPKTKEKDNIKGNKKSVGSTVKTVEPTKRHRREKIEQVLSSGLLDIGTNEGTASSWSAGTSQPKVAVGPIMSSWSAFAGVSSSVNFDSFGSKGLESKYIGNVDIDMDFALPHDLLSHAIESDEEVNASSQISTKPGTATNDDDATTNTNSNTQSGNKRLKKHQGRPPPRGGRFNNKKTYVSSNSKNQPSRFKRGKSQNGESATKPSFKKNPRFSNRQRKNNDQQVISKETE